ncbi:MAG TPA: thioredoxin domain-containing protein [Candidatus Koribacter sp.]|jgi:protein-disulfide isomerase
MADTQLAKRIENQLRAHFGVPAQVSVRVGDPKPSDFPGYNTVTITMSDAEKSKQYDFLLSKDNKTLARLTTLDITKDPFEETMAKIDTTGRPVRGNKDAKVTIVNYDDFECPFCAQMHQTMIDVVKKFGDQVRVIYKDYPLSEIHPWADRAAIDSNCLAVQNGDAFWDFADYVHANQGTITGKEQHRTQAGMNEAVDKVTLDIGRKHSLNVDALQACVKDQSQKRALEKSVAEASGLDVSATPTLFVNGERLEGVVSEDTLVDVIKKHLQDETGAAQAGK